MDITAMHDSGTLGIVIEHNAETIVQDGTVLRSNVYRPDGDARYPGLFDPHPLLQRSGRNRPGKLR